MNPLSVQPHTEEATFIAECLRAEAQAILRIAQRTADGETQAWTDAVNLLESCQGHVVVAGLGKSGQIGAKISATFASLGQPSHFGIERDLVIFLQRHEDIISAGFVGRGRAAGSSNWLQ